MNTLPFHPQSYVMEDLLPYRPMDKDSYNSPVRTGGMSNHESTISPASARVMRASQSAGLCVSALPISSLCPPRGGKDRPSRKRKRVHFESEPRVIDKLECPNSDYWYSKKELHDMKRAAKLQCKRSWDANLNDLALAYPTLVGASDDRCEKLATVLSQSPDFERFRGLEHMSSKSLCLSRGMVVLNAHTELLLDQVSSKCLGISAADSGEDLSRKCAEHSRPASIYARIVALADAAAIGRRISSG